MNEKSIKINGKAYTVGSELLIAYGRGTQKVRIAEITRTGRVRLDRYNASSPGWFPSNTLYNPATDNRFCF